MKFLLVAVLALAHSAGACARRSVGEGFAGREWRARPSQRWRWRVGRASRTAGATFSTRPSVVRPRDACAARVAQSLRKELGGLVSSLHPL